MQKGDWNAELAKLRETRAAINAQISELKQQEAYSAQLAKS